MNDAEICCLGSELLLINEARSREEKLWPYLETLNFGEDLRRAIFENWNI